MLHMKVNSPPFLENLFWQFHFGFGRVNLAYVHAGGWLVDGWFFH